MLSFRQMPVALCAACLSLVLASPVISSRGLEYRRARAGNPKLNNASDLLVSASQIQASRASVMATATDSLQVPTDPTTFARPSATAISDIADSISAIPSTSIRSDMTKGPATFSLAPVTVGLNATSVLPTVSAKSTISTSPASSSTASSTTPKATAYPDFWIGGNSYYLHTYSDGPRRQVLNAMQAVGMKTVRIFVSHVYANNKGSPNVAMNDVEPSTPGVYDPTILLAVDQLMVDCQARGMKLIIALHDRYALGFWDTDSYALKYGIVNPGTSGAQQIADASAFYTTTSAKVSFDARIKYILNHKNALLGNKRWADLDSAIYAFEPQNEPMGHMAFFDGWTCDRASTIKSQLGNNSPILVSTGGGITLQTSLANWAYSCPSFDIVSAHDYGTDPSTTIPALLAGQAQAKKSGKVVHFGEWGASGVNKAAVIQAFVVQLAKAGIPHHVWEITLPGAGQNDFEIWTNEPAWNAFSSNVKLNTIATQKSKSKREHMQPRIGIPIKSLKNNRILLEAPLLHNSTDNSAPRKIFKPASFRRHEIRLQPLHKVVI